MCLTFTDRARPCGSACTLYFLAAVSGLVIAVIVVVVVVVLGIPVFIAYRRWRQQNYRCVCVFY